MAELFSFLADQATSLVLDAGRKLLVEGVGIQPVFLGNGGVPSWIGQPNKADVALASIELPPGCSFNSSGALVVDLAAVAAGSGLESGLSGTFFWGDPLESVDDLKRLIPAGQPPTVQRVEAEFLLPPSLTQASVPSGAAVGVGIGWPAHDGFARAYLASQVIYHPVDGVVPNAVSLGSFGSASVIGAFDLANHPGQKCVISSVLGHQFPTQDPKLAVEWWKIESDYSSFYSGSESADVDPELHFKAWIEESVLAAPRPFLFLAAPSSWEAGQEIQVRSFGVR